MLRPTAHRAASYLVLTAWLGAFAPAPLHGQQNISLGIEESRDFGLRALSTGRPDVAHAIAMGLLQRDPNDLQALLMLSAAQTALKSGDEGAKTGKLAFSLAEIPIDRFTAARLVASGKTQGKHYLQAELWLRRALQSAPSPYYRDIAKREFRLVKRQNPLSLAFTFGVAPSSNINNGASSDTVWLFGFPFAFIVDGERQALSGVEYTTGLRATYRVHQTATRATDVGLLLYGKTYTLSSSAQTQAPDAKASDYSFFTTELSASHRALSNRGKTVLTYSATLGQNWYGGNPLNRYYRLGISQKHSISPKLSRKLSFSAEHQSRISFANYDLTTLAASGSLSFRTKGNGRLTVSLEGRTANGSNRGGEFTSAKIAMDYTLGKPIWGTDVTFSLSAANRDYPSSVFSADGREDTRVSAGISLLFKKTELFGFSPTLDFRTTKTDSNIGLYDTESFTVKLGLRSTF